MDAINNKSNEVEHLRDQLNTLQQKADQDGPQLRFKSNKTQFKFNTKIQGKFRQILSHANSDQAQKDIASEGMSLINHRNKIILIADRDGRDVADCFTSDPLAEGEQEEQRLKAARKEALRAREAKAQSKKVGRNRFTSRFTRPSGTGPQSLTVTLRGPSIFAPLRDSCSSTQHLKKKSNPCVVVLAAGGQGISFVIVGSHPPQ